MTQKSRDIVEGTHYYREPGGRMIFTETYHLERGWCCHGRCRHCPWRSKPDEQHKSEETKE